nr:hypothetical protein [uncultured Roseibium sp.]
MELNDEVVVVFKKILESQGINTRKHEYIMQTDSHIDTGRELTAERLLLRIMKLEHTVQELRQENTFKDKEIKRLEGQMRDWQQVTLKLQSRVAKRV